MVLAAIRERNTDRGSRVAPPGYARRLMTPPVRCHHAGIQTLAEGAPRQARQPLGHLDTGHDKDGRS